MSGRIAEEIAQTAPVPSPAVELVLNIRRTAVTLDAWIEQVLKPGELNVEEFNILRILRGAGPDGHPRAEVERRLVAGADKFTVSVHHLRTRGLLEGAFTLRITTAGQDVLKLVDDRLAAAIGDLGGGIPAAQIQTTISILEHVRQKTGG